MQPRSMMLEERAQSEQREAKNRRDQHVESIEKHQLRKLREIAHDAQLGSEVGLRRDPSDVAPDETLLSRRMNVGRLVGSLMMQSMMRRPPQRAALHRSRPDHREYELAGARSLERSMRKIAMGESGDREHPDEIQSNSDADRDGTPSHPDDAHAHQMNHDERDASKPVGLLRRIGIGAAANRSVKPSCD